MACEMQRIKVVMNKPVYLGQAILDLSKTVMYGFHYDYMVQKYSSDRLHGLPSRVSPAGTKVLQMLHGYRLSGL